LPLLSQTQKADAVYKWMMLSVLNVISRQRKNDEAFTVPDLYHFYGPEDGKLRYFKHRNKHMVIPEALNVSASGGKKYRKKRTATTRASPQKMTTR
jgi:hypothetical protein